MTKKGSLELLVEIETMPGTVCEPNLKVINVKVHAKQALEYECASNVCTLCTCNTATELQEIANMSGAKNFRPFFNCQKF